MTSKFKKILRIRFGDNHNYLDDIPPSLLVRINYERFPLQKSDETFKRIRIEKFKEKINTCKK